MSQNYMIKLNITLSDGGNSAAEIIELYGIQIRDDIDQTAWNLCDCDDSAQREKFSELAIDNWSVDHKPDEHFQVRAQFTVIASDEEFINKVIEEYMDGFADWITVTQNGLYSRTGERTGFNPYPLEWEVEIV